jgi:Ser/Thr protein kinase RdoA (MazF antagonist)
MPFRLPLASVRSALAAWPLAPPLRIRRLPGGITSDTFIVGTNAGRYVAKLVSDPADVLETSLRAAELVEHGSALATGGALRTHEGNLTEIVDCPDGRRRPLAVVGFVPGRPLDWASPGAASVAGEVLGTVHGLLWRYGFDAGVSDHLFAYLQDEGDTVSEPGRVWPAIRAAVAAVRRFEEVVPVTYGAVYGHDLDLLVDARTGRLGLIAWSAVSPGPLLFDVAMAGRRLQVQGGLKDLSRFFEAYLERSPVRADELAGLDDYRRLRMAQLARFHAARAARPDEHGPEAAAESAERLAGLLSELGA